MCEEPPSPGLREGVSGTLDFVTSLVALPQGGGVKHYMLPMPGPRVMAASVSCYRVVQVDVRDPFDKGRLAVPEHVA